MKLGGHTVHYTFGYFEDGTVGEVFVDISKYGAALRDWAGATAMLVSMLLQHGATPQEIAKALRNVTSDTVDVVGHESITRADGPLDMLAQALELEAQCESGS